MSPAVPVVSQRQKPETPALRLRGWAALAVLALIVPVMPAWLILIGYLFFRAARGAF